MSTHINIDKVTRIVIRDKERHYLYTYKKGIKFLCITIFSEGYYWGDYYFRKEELDSSYIIENNIVYTRPFIKIFFSDGENIKLEFETLDDAIEFKDKHFKGKLLEIKFN